VISPLELSANGIATLSILLAGRNSVHTWWTGIVGCVLFGVLFLQSQLYADVLLQGFFLVTSALGWWQWVRGNHGRSLAISTTPRFLLGWAAAVGIVATLGYGALLHRFTDAYAPFVDSAVMAFSVIAQILLMQRRIETWIFWLLVNTVAVPLYLSRDLHLTAALYAAYWVNALVSWWHWRRIMRRIPCTDAESGFA
jgi:nicotinamide mononucleotide transporter